MDKAGPYTLAHISRTLLDRYDPPCRRCGTRPVVGYGPGWDECLARGHCPNDPGIDKTSSSCHCDDLCERCLEEAMVYDILTHAGGE